MSIDYELLKKSLGLAEGVKIKVKSTKSGYVVTYVQKYGIDKRTKEKSILFWYSVPYTAKKEFPCKHCGDKLSFDEINFHHIIFKSAGGLDDYDNLIPLCFQCHVGDRAIHANKWDIVKVVKEDHYLMLKGRYGIKVKSGM